MTEEERNQILARIKQACKDHKIEEDSVPTTWAEKAKQEVEVIPTPSARLNAAIGVGGIPLGRITEIFGSFSSGKTTLTLQIMAQAQKMGMVCAYIDMEHSLDAKYAEALGVDMSSVLITQPVDGDTAMKLTRALLQSGVRLIVIDSIPALVASQEYEKEITDSHVGLQARMLNQGVRQISPLVNRAGASVIFINQIREKIGVMWGNPETTPGGNAMKFYASLRLDLRATSTKDEERRTSKIKVVKNKLAPPFKWCEVDIIYGKGFDTLKDTVLYAKDLGIITGKSWMELPLLECEGLIGHDGDPIKLQGIQQVMDFVSGTPGYLEALMVECQKQSRGNREEEKLQEVLDNE